MAPWAHPDALTSAAWARPRRVRGTTELRTAHRRRRTLMRWPCHSRQRCDRRKRRHQRKPRDCGQRVHRSRRRPAKVPGHCGLCELHPVRGLHSVCRLRGLRRVHRLRRPARRYRAASCPRLMRRHGGATTSSEGHHRVRHDRIGDSGVVTLCVRRPAAPHRHRANHARTHVLLLSTTSTFASRTRLPGELRRELVLDPSRDYQPTGAPKGPTKNNNS
jgi:hypothetical protein